LPRVTKSVIFPSNYFLPELRGEIRAIRKATLIKEIIKDKDAIRLEGYSNMLFVSDKIKNLFEKSGFTGASFVEVDAT